MKSLTRAFVFLPFAAFAQGPLPPPAGPPAISMKTLEQIWNRIGTLETQVVQAQADLTLTKTQLQQIRTDNALLTGALSSSALNLAWNLTTVDAPGDTGRFPSLAFDADGYPAISYYDTTAQDLRLARFNGTAWITATVDAAGNAGQNSSLAFNPAGRPRFTMARLG